MGGGAGDHVVASCQSMRSSRFLSCQRHSILVFFFEDVIERMYILQIYDILIRLIFGVFMSDGAIER